MKNDETRTHQELSDIEFLLSLPEIDHAEVRAYFEKHGLEHRFEEINGS